MRNWQYLLLGVLLLIAFVSLGQGVSNALIRSQDFQWSPSILLREGINPYEYYLDGNKGHRLILMQNPNYLHGLYVVLYPLSFLEWGSAKIAWAILNIAFALFAVIIISRHARLEILSAIFVVSVFFCSSAFRNAIGNGQQSLFVLLAFSLILHESKPFILASGLGYMKYSFAPPFGFYLIAKRGFGAFSVSTMPAVAGFLIFLAMQHGGNAVAVLFQPLLVSAQAVRPGIADVMSLAELNISDKFSIYFLIFYYFIPLSFSAIVGTFCGKSLRDPLREVAAMSVLSLILFKHLLYDFVFLLPAFVLFFRDWRSMPSKVGMAFVLYFWFGLKVITIVLAYAFPGSDFDSFFRILNFLVLLSLLLTLLFTEKLSLHCYRFGAASACPQPEPTAGQS